MNATEITEFFLKWCQRHGRPGRCFEGWGKEKVFNYVLVNLVHRNVFAARDRFGLIALAAIAWPADAATIIAKAERGLPQFDWKGFPTDGDSILIADVAGDRRLCPRFLSKLRRPGWCQHWRPRRRPFYRNDCSLTAGESWSSWTGSQ